MAAQEDHVKVVFIDLPSRIAVEETLSASTTFPQFLALLHDMLMKESKNIYGLPTAFGKGQGFKFSHQIWWWRAVKIVKSPTASGSPGSSTSQTHKSTWMELNSYHQFETLRKEVALQVMGHDGWIEVEHDLQKRRDEAAAQVAQIASANWRTQIIDTSFLCTSYENQQDTAGGVKSSKNDGKQVEGDNDNKLPFDGGPGPAIEEDSAELAHLKAVYEKPLIVRSPYTPSAKSSNTHTEPFPDFPIDPALEALSKQPQWIPGNSIKSPSSALSVNPVVDPATPFFCYVPPEPAQATKNPIYPYQPNPDLFKDEETLEWENPAPAGRRSYRSNVRGDRARRGNLRLSAIERPVQVQYQNNDFHDGALRRQSDTVQSHHGTKMVWNTSAPQTATSSIPGMFPEHIGFENHSFKSHVLDSSGLISSTTMPPHGAATGNSKTGIVTETQLGTLNALNRKMAAFDPARSYANSQGVWRTPAVSGGQGRTKQWQASGNFPQPGPVWGCFTPPKARSDRGDPRDILIRHASGSLGGIGNTNAQDGQRLQNRPNFGDYRGQNFEAGDFRGLSYNGARSSKPSYRGRLRGTSRRGTGRGANVVAAQGDDNKQSRKKQQQQQQRAERDARARKRRGEQDGDAGEEVRGGGGVGGGGELSPSKSGTDFIREYAMEKAAKMRED